VVAVQEMVSIKLWVFESSRNKAHSESESPESLEARGACVETVLTELKNSSPVLGDLDDIHLSIYSSRHTSCLQRRMSWRKREMKRANAEEEEEGGRSEAEETTDVRRRIETQVRAEGEESQTERPCKGKDER